MTSKKNVDLDVATIKEGPQDQVTIRLKEGARLSAEAIGRILEARRLHFGEQPHHVIWVAPQDLDFDMAVMNTDHCRQHIPDLSKSITWVANSPLTLNLLNLYYAYFPSRAPVKFFLNESEARQWLLMQGARADMN